jgi:psiF repeat
MSGCRDAKADMIRMAIGAALLSLAVGMGPAAAQAPAPGAEKQAISKSCSDQANAKGLHGKARKRFRSACKKKGGNAP